MYNNSASRQSPSQTITPTNSNGNNNNNNNNIQNISNSNTLQPIHYRKPNDQDNTNSRVIKRFSDTPQVSIVNVDKTPSLTSQMTHLNPNGSDIKSTCFLTQLSSSSTSSLSKLNPISNSNTQISNDWVPIKSHTPKCNIILRKSRRKRSKSLPSKFK